MKDGYDRRWHIAVNQNYHLKLTAFIDTTLCA